MDNDSILYISDRESMHNLGLKVLNTLSIGGYNVLRQIALGYEHLEIPSHTLVIVLAIESMDEALTYAKSHKISKNATIPLVVIRDLAWDYKSSERQFLQAGVDAFLNNIFNAGRVCCTILDIIRERKHAQRQLESFSQPKLTCCADNFPLPGLLSMFIYAEKNGVISIMSKDLHFEIGIDRDKILWVGHQNQPAIYSIADACRASLKAFTVKGATITFYTKPQGIIANADIHSLPVSIEYYLFEMARLLDEKANHLP